MNIATAGQDAASKTVLKQSRCVDCGNNQVPHILNWYNESLGILLTPLRKWLLYNPLSKAVKAKAGDKNFLLRLVGLLEKIKIITRQGNRGDCKVRRAQVLWEEAEKRGMKMYGLKLLGKPIDVYVLEKSEIVFSGLPRPRGYDNRILDIMDDKWLFKKMMVENGLPVPMGASVWNFGQARRVFKRIQNTEYRTQNLDVSVIVKPRTGSRGRHSTTFVRTEEDLKKAFKSAKKLCFWAVVEEQLAGPVYRATVVNNELAGVLRGDPPQVIGDGSKNIEQLINEKNLSPHPGVANILIDRKMEIFLEREIYQNTEHRMQNMELGENKSVLSYVPARGEVISLSEKIGVSYGGSSSEDFEVCHPDNKELFEQAAKVLGDPIVGFDFIIPDITKSYKGQKCGFIEANSLPFINLHHDPLHGRPRNVAAKVWDMLDY